MIYLIECKRAYDTIYKIGRSKDPSKRLNNLSTGTDGNLKIVYTFESNFESKLEKSLHNFYSHNKINKEWFALDIQEVVNFIPICQRTENNLDILSSNFNI